MGSAPGSSGGNAGGTSNSGSGDRPGKGNEGTAPPPPRLTESGPAYDPKIPVPSTASKEPVRYFDGIPIFFSTDLESDGFGRAFAQTRSWSGYDGTNYGFGWESSAVPRLIDYDNDTVVVVTGGTSRRFFDLVSEDTFVARDYSLETLEIVTPGDLLFTDTVGNEFRFFNGRLYSIKEAGTDVETAVAETSDGFSLTRTYPEQKPAPNASTDRVTQEQLLYEDALPDGDAVGHVVLRRRSYDWTHGAGGEPNEATQPWTNVRQVDYSYYRGSWTRDQYIPALSGLMPGRAGDLRAASISDPAAEQTPTEIRASGSTTATVTLNSHGYHVGDTVVIRGFSDGTGLYNGTFIVKTATTNTFTYTLDSVSTNYDTGSQLRVVKALDTSTYRYWQAHTHLDKDYSPIRLIVTGESYARLRAAGVDPFDAATTDDAIKPYADHYFRYEAWEDHEAYTNPADGYKDRFRVIEELAQGAGCSACTGGQGLFKYSYSLNGTADTDRTSTQYNVWRYKTIEYLPDTTNTPTTATLAAGALTRSGTTATIAWTAHGFQVGERVTVSGAAQAQYNGDFEITSVAANTFTFMLLDVPAASPATGTVAVSIDTQYRDNDQNVVYTNEVGEVMLQSSKESATGREWITASRFDGSGRILWTAAPSAVSGYDSTKGDLLDFNAGTSNFLYLRDDQGLIETTSYYTGSDTLATTSTPGGVVGYYHSTSIKKGELGTPVPQYSQDYIKHSGSSADTYPVNSETVYPDGATARTTTYEYSWYSGTVAVASVKTTFPVVTSTQNGPGTADTFTSYLDKLGRTNFTKDGDGYVNYFEYDNGNIVSGTTTHAGTGALVKSVVDADTSQTGDFSVAVPSGLSSPGGTRLRLSETTTVDSLGRPLKVTDPNGKITFSVYKDAEYEVRVYPGWNSATNTTTGPIQVTREYRPLAGAGELVYTELLTANVTPASSGGAPTGAETFTAAQIQYLSRDFTNRAGQHTFTDRYFDLAGLTYGSGVTVDSNQVPGDLGTKDTHFYRTEYGYNKRGLPDKIVNANGTVTRIAYDSLGRKKSEWVGTSDTGWTEAATSHSNMVKVAEYVYDQYINTLPAPAAPTLTTTASGTLASRTYYVVVTYVGASGETLSSSESTIAVPANSVLRVSSPSASGGATGYHVYVSTQTGKETRQTGGTPITIGTPWTEPTSGLTSGEAVRVDQVGNGNLTAVVWHPTGTTDTASDRVSRLYYDWRDRNVAVKSGDQGGTGETNLNVQRQIVYYDYNNVDQVTATYLFDGDGLAVADGNGDGVPDNPVAANAAKLRGKSALSYDEQGRTFRADVYSVDTGGTVGANTLRGDVWYDRRGNVLKMSQSGGLVSKYHYDGDGRADQVFATDGGGDMGWADADDVSGDVVLEQVETTYDANGNPVFVASKQRFHDETATGSLNSALASPKARVSYTARAYDALNRPTAVADVGATRVTGAATAGTTTTLTDTARTEATGSFVGYRIRITGGQGAGQTGTVSAYNGTTKQFTVSSAFTTAPNATSTYLVMPSELTTTNAYNSAGHLDYTLDPRGLKTAYTYDLAGRITRQIEAYADGNPSTTPGVSEASTDRVTEYTYDGLDHVKTLTAVLLLDGADSGTEYDGLQRTQYNYGVTVAGGSNLNSNDLLASIQFPDIAIYPDKPSGLPGDANTDKEFFKYNALGETKSMTDQNGTAHAFSFDVLGRVTADVATLPSPNTIIVDNTVTRIETGYDSAGRAQTFSSYAGALSAGITRSGSIATVTTSTVHTYVPGDTVTISGATQPEYNGTFVIVATPSSTTFTYAVTGSPATPATGSTITSKKLVNQVQRAYNGLGQLTAEYQAHAGAVNTSTTLAVRYAYHEMSNGDNNSRLESLAYPDGRKVRYEYDLYQKSVSTITYSGTTATATSTAHGLTVGEKVVISGAATALYNGVFTVVSVTADTFTYTLPSNPGQNAGGSSIKVKRWDVDEQISRLSFKADDIGGSVGTHLEEYSYLGLATIVERNRPEPGTKLTYFLSGGTGDAGDPYVGMDRFGRVIDQRWVKGASTDLDRFKYGYDADGNRLFKENTLSSTNSELYHANGSTAGYDTLNRLTDFRRGTLSDANSDGVYDTVTTAGRTQGWALDAVGNWDGSAGVTTDGTAQVRDHDQRNELTNVGAATLLYDSAGNMKKDESGKGLNYDAWNRLVGFDANYDGDAVDPNDVAYASDALGRRIVRDPNPGLTTDLYHSSDWQVLEEREDGGVKYQNVWGSGYVDDLILRDSPNAAIDNAFNSSGILTTNIGGASDTIYGVAIQADGKIVTGGAASNNFALTRYNRNGGLDTTFDGDGIRTTDIGTSTTDGIEDIAVQPDGKIVAVGFSGSDFAVVRYKVDGSLDTSFDTDGKLTTDFGATDVAYSVVIQADGKIVVAGQSGNDFALARYNPDGSLDTGFDTDGKVTTDFSAGADKATGVAIDPSTGMIVVSGYVTISGQNRFGIARYVASGVSPAPGTLDTTFDSDGRKDVSITGSDYAEAVVVQPDGKIIVGGWTLSGSNYDFMLARLTTAGVLDTSFDSDGLVRTDFYALAQLDQAFDIALMPDGRIVAAGLTYAGATNGNDFAVARYRPNGSLDTTFNGTGSVTTNYTTTDRGYAVALEPGGRVVVAGTSGGDFALVRYGERLYAQQDANYNMTSVTNAAGAVQERYVYDPYGPLTYKTATWSVRASSSYGWVYLHQGGRLDSGTGLYHFRNRDYSPTLGRWIEPDPVGYLDGLNPYQGYRSEPTTLTDPFGLAPDPQWQLQYNLGMANFLITGGGDFSGAERLAILELLMNESWNRAMWHWDVANGKHGRSDDACPPRGTADHMSAYNFWLDEFKEYKRSMERLTAFNATSWTGPIGGVITFDDILKDDKRFDRWLKHKHPANKPLDLIRSREVWDKLCRMGKNPRLDGPHVGTQWNVPHINIPGTSIHIPVDPGFVP